MDGGSAYGVGNTMHVVGMQPQETPTFQQLSWLHQSMTTEVTLLNRGVTSETNQPYNTVYRLTNLEVGAAKVCPTI